MNLAARDKTAWVILTVLLLVLCIRLIIVEPLTGGAFVGTGGLFNIGGDLSWFTGSPAEVFGFAVLTLALTGAAIMLLDGFTRAHWLGITAIIVLLIIAATSAAGAANRFAALVGVCDLGMALLGGWTVARLCDTDARRQFVVVVLAGILAGFVAQGLYQHFVTMPATIAMFNQNKKQWFAQQGWLPGDPDIALFESRLNSNAVFGFLTLSDILAAAMLPLLMSVLASSGLSLWNWIVQDNNGTKNEFKNSRKNKDGKNYAETKNQTFKTAIFIPALILLLVFASGLVVLWLTRSKGAIIAMALGVAVLIIGWVCRSWMAANRWKLVLAALIGAVLIAGVVIGYGLKLHTLPTKDLAFRWQYWTGAVGMIADHPWLGVGMDNFGYYYTQYKPLGAPEDVTDPHNMFVHIAAEAGLPAALIFAGLVLAAFFGAVRRDHPDASTDSRWILPPELLTLFVLAWWLPKLMLDAVAGLQSGDGPLNDNVRLCVLCIGAVLLVMFASNRTWSLLDVPSRRCVGLSAVLGTAGLALYDQVNLAAVTGPVAMLFWITLGGFAARLEAHSVSDANQNSINKALGAGFLIASVVLAVFVFIPTASGTFSLDPEPYQERYEMAAQLKQPLATREAAALEAVNGVLDRDQRSQDWLKTRIQLEILLGQNPRQNVLRLLDINRTDADVHIDVALSSKYGLTNAERIAQLKLALKLNAALPQDEIQRLSDQQVVRIQQLIAQLQTKSLSQ
jgi:O-antigen ligase